MPGPWFYECVRSKWGVRNEEGDKVTTYARLWNVGYDDKGQKIGNIRYFMPYPTHTQEMIGVELDKAFASIECTPIFDEVEIAKLVLMGL